MTELSERWNPGTSNRCGLRKPRRILLRGAAALLALLLLPSLQAASLFSDDFTRGTDPGPLTPWASQSGNWTVTGGSLQGGTNVTQSYGILSLTNNWADYAIEGRIRFPAGAFGGGLGARVNAANGARYAAWIYPEGSIGGSRVLKLLKFQSWNSFGYNSVNAVPMQQVGLSNVGTNWHSLKLALVGSQLTIFFDQNQILTYNDGELQTYTNGGVSVEMWTDSSPYALNVDDIVVTGPTTDQTITFNPPGNHTYGDAPFWPNVQASSGLPVNLTVVSGPATMAGTNIVITGIGTVTVRASQSGDSTFKAAAAIDRTFSVLPAQLTVTADAKAKVYGAAVPALTASYSGFVNGETTAVLSGAPTLGTAAQAGSNAGTYQITTAIGTLSASNYTFVLVNGQLTITPATLTVAANNASRPYGVVNPAFAANYSGFVNSDTANVLSGQPGFSCTATTNALPGTYPIAVNTGSLGATNYQFSFVSGTLTIQSARLAYGDDFIRTNDPAGTSPWVVQSGAWSITGGAMVAGTNPTHSYGFAYLTNSWPDYTVEARLQFPAGAYGGGLGGRLNPTTGGHYAAWVYPEGSVGGSSVLKLIKFQDWANFSYNGSSVPMQQVSLPGVGTNWHSVQMTFQGTQIKVYYDATLMMTVTDTESVPYTNGGVSLDLWTDATPYVMNADEVTVTTPVTGQSISFLSLADKTYGDGSFSLAASSSSGLPVSFSVFSGPATLNGSTLTITGAGNVTIRASQTGNNDFLPASSVDRAFTVNPAPLGISADGKSKVYGTGDPGLTYKITSGGLVGSDALSGALTRVAGEPVGNYAILQGTLTSGVNYALSFNSTNLSITPASLTVAADPKSKVYGNSDPAFSYQVTAGALVGSDTLSGSLSRVPGETVRSYAINQGSLTAGTNYSLTFNSANLTITTAPLGVSPDAKTKVYGDADPALTYHISSGALVGSDSLVGSLSRVAGENAGSYAINQGSLTAGTNYSLAFSTGNLTITARPLLVKGDNKSRAYGSPNPAFTISYSGFVGTDSAANLAVLPTASSSAQTTSPIGIYTIALSGGSDTNYSLVLSNGTLTVTTAALAVTADAKTKVYGASDPALTYQITGGALVGSDALSGSLGRVAGETVGTYAINQGTLTAGSNYTLTFNPTNLAVTPAALTVAADAKIKVYGAADPVLTYHISAGALVGGDSMAGTLSRAVGETVGNYSINQGSLTAGTNYSLTFNSANLNITAAPLGITADSKTKVYGDADPVLTYHISGGALVGTDSLAGALVRASGENAGNYAINQGSLTAGTNYALTFNSANLTITPKSLLAKADNKSRAYGSPNPAFTISYSGFVGTDSVANLAVLPNATSVAQTTSPIGTYPIALSGGSDTNYSLVLSNGALTVSTALLSITADPKTKIYGATDPSLTYQITSGALIGSDAFTGSLGRLAGETVGNYAINQGTLSAGTNYTLTFNPANLTVAPAALTVAADPKTKGYGTTDPSLTYHISAGALVGSDSLVGALGRAAGETVGTYAINHGTLSAGTNYSLTFNSANLSITPASLTVSADAKTKVYGDPDPALTYHISSGALFGTDTLTGSLLRVSGENAGSYAITQGSLTAGSNYSLNFNSANLTVTPKPLLAQANNKSRAYGALNPAFTISYLGFVGGDSVTNLAALPLAGTAAISNSPVGTYDIVLSGGSDTNYSLVLSNGVLTVTVAGLTVTADPKTKVYGTADPALTYQITAGGLIGNDVFSGSLVRVAGENVGSYSINEGTLTAGTNYTLNFNPANLAITPAGLTVVADSKAKIYGTLDPALTYHLSSGALVGSDSLSGTLNRAAGESVGSYAINQGTLTAGTNYSLGFTSGGLVISRAPLSITADAEAKVYGATDPSLTYQITSGALVGSDSLSGSLGRIAGENVGSYAINQGTLNAGSNYLLGFNSANLTISAAPLGITADAKTKNYGDVDPALTYHMSSGALVGGDTLSGSPTRVAGENVGSYVINKGSLTAGANYSLSFNPASLTVTPAPLMVSADAKTKFYGASDPTLTYHIASGALVGSDTLSGALIRVFGETVGNYAITQGELSAGPNYSLSFNSANLSIVPAALTVRADAKSKVYGAADPELTYRVISGALIGSDGLAGSLSRSPGETVGAYAINQGTLTAGTNYLVTFTSANLTIAPATLAIVAELKAKVYGASDPSLTYHISSGALVGADSLSGSLIRAAGEGVGIYAINQGTLSAGANYALTFTPANLTIIAAPLGVTADAKTKVYGASDPALTYHISSGTLVGSDSLSGSLTRAAGESAGSYSINQGTLSAGTNYSLSFNSANFSITPKALLAQADDKARGYGTPNPAFTISYFGFVGSDTISNLAVLPLATTLAQSNSPVGTYDIVMSGGSDTNYSLVLSNGALTVTAAALTIAAEPKSKTYGAADPALTYQITAGQLVGSDLLSGSLNRVPGESVGAYTISQGTLTAGTNYAITFTPANLTITAALLTVSADAKTKIYGDADPALTYHVSSGALVGSDVISGVPNRVPGENAGSYAIGQGTLSAGTNYALTFNPANLSIMPRALLAQADNKTRAYGSFNPSFTVSYTGFIGADSAINLAVLPIASTVAQTNSPIGNYDIVLTGGSDTNYSLVLSNGMLTVTSAALSITADSQSKVYGTVDPALTYHISGGGLVGNDILTGSLNRAAGETVGAYGIAQGTLTAGTNYSVSFTPANLTITPALLGITADAKTKVYGDIDPALTYHISSGALVGTDALAGALVRSAGENAGSYAINQGSLSAGINYAVTFNSANLNIIPRALLAQVDNKTRTYGTSNPVFTISYTGFVGTDTVTNLAVLPVATTPAQASSPIGSYDIVLTGGSDTNYSLVLSNGTLTVTPAGLTVTADSKTKMYGATDPVLTYQITAGALITGDSLSGSLSRVAGETIGTYAINEGTLKAGTNYSLNFTSANLTITPASLTISADGKSKVYGAADPALTYQITSGVVVGGDSLTGSLTRVAGENVGTYAISQGTLTAGTNYTLNFAPANLTIAPAGLTISADAKSKVYGSADPALTYQITSGGLVRGDSLSGSLTRVAGESVGSYAITQGTLGAGTNYALTFSSANLTVQPASLTVSADAKTKVYGAADPAFTYQITAGGLIGGDTLIGSLSRVAGENAGTYAINPGTLTAGTNYSIGFNSANLTITKAQSTTALASSVNPSVQGSNVIFTSTLTPVAPAITVPTGSVQFLTNGVSFGSPVSLVAGVATLNIAALPAGSILITAAYPGDGNFTGSTNSLTQVVSPLNDVPRTLGLVNNGNGTVTVQFAGIPGVQYVVQAATSLAQPITWVNISTNVAGSDGTWTITNSTAGYPQRFYRSGKLQSQSLIIPDRPAALGVVDNHDGTVTANFSGTAGAQYVVQAADSLVQPMIWQDVSTNTAELDGHWKYTEPTLGRPQRFYRAGKLLVTPSAVAIQPPSATPKQGSAIIQRFSRSLIP